MTHSEPGAGEREPRVALLSGCSSAFGMLSSIERARRGLRAFASLRDLARAERLARAAAEAAVRVELLELDVTAVASIESATASAGSSRT